jgi:hypothetical protein
MRICAVGALGNQQWPWGTGAQETADHLGTVTFSRRESPAQAVSGTCPRSQRCQPPVPCPSVFWGPRQPLSPRACLLGPAGHLLLDCA